MPPEDQPQIPQLPSWRLDPLTQLLGDVQTLKKDVSEINKKLDDHYVTQDQFDPVKRLVYGLVGVILLGFMTGLIGLIISNKK